MTHPSPKQIVVENFPVPSQVGDAAIAAGAVKLLRTAFPDARIIGIAFDVDVGDAANVRGFLETYDLDGVVQRPPLGSSRDLALWRQLSASLSLARRLGPQVGTRLSGCLGPLVRTIAESDLLVVRGGGYISSPHLAGDLIGLRLNAMYIAGLARALHVPYAFWGHTFFQLSGPLSRRILWPFIADSAITVCREHLSEELLLSMGAPAAKLVVLPDTAFALGPCSPERTRQVMDQEGLTGSAGRLLGLNVRPTWDVSVGGPDLRDGYLSAVAQMVDHMQQTHDATVVLVSHCHSTPLYRVPSFQDEKQLHAALLEKLRSSREVRVLQGEYHPCDLIGLYSTFQATVTTRLHAGILSACAGTPSVCIAYEKTKTHGIARMLGLDEFVIDIEDVTAERLTERVERAWCDEGRLRTDLETTVSQLRAQLPQYAELTVKGMSERPDTRTRG